jgi:hypothetical protein
MGSMPKVDGAETPEIVAAPIAVNNERLVSSILVLV